MATSMLMRHLHPWLPILVSHLQVWLDPCSTAASVSTICFFQLIPTSCLSAFSKLNCLVHSKTFCLFSSPSSLLSFLSSINKVFLTFSHFTRPHFPSFHPRSSPFTPPPLQLRRKQLQQNCGDQNYFPHQFLWHSLSFSGKNKSTSIIHSAFYSLSIQAVANILPRKN